MRAKILAAGLMALIPSLTLANATPPPILVTGLCASGGEEVADKVDAAPVKAALMSGYGTTSWKVTTASPDAQAFFDNGLNLAHAFAHKEAIAAFAEAVHRDPTCAMCLWGQAWSAGPTINYTIDAKAQAEQAALVAHAETLATNGPPLERQLIAALKLRYEHGGGKGPGDQAFAKAMADIARAHPDDDVLAVLAADAWMIPASLKDRKENLPPAVALLETVLKRSPDDPAAIHFYIHATEWTSPATWWPAPRSCRSTSPGPSWSWSRPMPPRASTPIRRPCWPCPIRATRGPSCRRCGAMDAARPWLVKATSPACGARRP